jgi:hypothetical protein
VRGRGSSEDKLCWVPSKRGLFYVRYYNVLIPHDSTPFPLEGYLAEQSSLESGVLCLDGSIREDPHPGPS